MNGSRWFRGLAVVGLLLGVVACTATYVVQQYAGEPRPNERVAILRLNGGSSIVVVALDGEELSYYNRDTDTRVHIEMLPGVHEVDVATLDDPTQRVVAMSFRAEAGKVYRIAIDSLNHTALARPWKPVIWEVDRENDRALRSVPTQPVGFSSTSPLPPPGVQPKPAALRPPPSAPSAAASPPSPATSPAASTAPIQRAPAATSPSQPTALPPAATTPVAEPSGSSPPGTPSSPVPAATAAPEPAE